MGNRGISHLKYSVYPASPLGGRCEPLPGYRIAKYLDEPAWHSDLDMDRFERKVFHSCRKLCYMWKASEEAVRQEKEFYSTTVKDAPVLYGESAIELQYHLEACVMFARSALDIASWAFSSCLPDPFPRKSVDSFNDLVKASLKPENRISISEELGKERNRDDGWMSLIAGTTKGRSLRDKLAHQAEFPIDYLELNPRSEKRSAIVWIASNKYLPLPQFLDCLCNGVIGAYLLFEGECDKFLSARLRKE